MLLIQKKESLLNTADKKRDDSNYKNYVNSEGSAIILSNQREMMKQNDSYDESIKISDN